MTVAYQWFNVHAYCIGFAPGCHLPLVLARLGILLKSSGISLHVTACDTATACGALAAMMATMGRVHVPLPATLSGRTEYAVPKPHYDKVGDITYLHCYAGSLMCNARVITDLTEKSERKDLVKAVATMSGGLTSKP